MASKSLNLWDESWSWWIELVNFIIWKTRGGARWRNADDEQFDHGSFKGQRSILSGYTCLGQIDKTQTLSWCVSAGIWGSRIEYLVLIVLWFECGMLIYKRHLNDSDMRGLVFCFLFGWKAVVGWGDLPLCLVSEDVKMSNYVVRPKYNFSVSNEDLGFGLRRGWTGLSYWQNSATAPRGKQFSSIKHFSD